MLSSWTTQSLPTPASPPNSLARAEITRAIAVVCAGDDDATNLENQLCWQEEPTPNLRVVARLTNDVLRAAVADDNGPGAIFNVAELAAPVLVVEACLSHTGPTRSRPPASISSHPAAKHPATGRCVRFTAIWHR